MPVGRMDCIDIGNDFFLIKFELQSDLEVVLKEGPWFVGQHFLAIRKWEPEFKAEEASLSFVAVWIRLFELPIEFYDPIILKKIGRAIGLVLHIDTHTANGARGHFARLCVQVNLDQPLINSVRNGKMVQPVQYEGISMLCFAYGRLGHRKGNCPTLIRSTDGANTNPSPLNSTKNLCSAKSLESDQTSNPLKEPDSSTPDKVTKLEATVYGEWMVVTQRKKPNGELEDPIGDDAWGQDAPTKPKDPQAIPRDMVPGNRKYMKRKAPVPNVGKDGLHGGLSHEKAFASQNAPKGKKGFSYKASSKVPKPNQRKPVADHVGNHSSGWEQNKWPPKPLVNTNSIFSFGAGSSKNDISRLPMGEIAEGEYNPSGEINNYRNPKGLDGDYRWYNTEEMEAWKNIFPLTEVSACLGYLPLTDEAWFTTPNLYWHFLMDQPKFPPLISQHLGHLF